jgi:hypothetical protein
MTMIPNRGSCRFPRWVSFSIAVTAILLYWIAGLVDVCLDGAFTPPTLCFFLYFAHYAAIGGLAASLVSRVINVGKHAMFWGAVVGAVIAALLMT